MKITSERIEISPSETIAWSEIKTMRLLNDTLAVVLSDGRTIEVTHLQRSTIDLAFRTYETYLRDHPYHPKKSFESLP